jgi:hypothetical protein
MKFLFLAILIFSSWTMAADQWKVGFELPSGDKVLYVPGTNSKHLNISSTGTDPKEIRYLEFWTQELQAPVKIFGSANFNNLDIWKQALLNSTADCVETWKTVAATTYMGYYMILLQQKCDLPSTTTPWRALVFENKKEGEPDATGDRGYALVQEAKVNKIDVTLLPISFELQ